MRSEVLSAAQQYLLSHPREIPRVLRNALGLRFEVPLDLFRWLAEKAEARGQIEDVELEPSPPGIRFAATVDIMRTPVRVSTCLFIERIRTTDEKLRIDLRIEEADLKLIEEVQTPVALLIKSGTLDVSRPANLIKHLPDLPDYIVSANGNRVSIDLLQHPAILEHGLTKKLVPLIASLLTIHGIDVGESHMEFSLRAVPYGFSGAARSLRKNLVIPGIRRVRAFLPGS